MKLEKRIVLIAKAGSRIVVTVLRGVKGIEYVSFFDSCTDVVRMILSRKGVAGEISAYLSIDGACKQELSAHTSLTNVDLGKAPRKLRRVIIDSVQVMSRVGALLSRGMIEVLRSDP